MKIILKNKQNKLGFTLFEMMMVIGLISILSGFVWYMVGDGPKKKSRDQRRRIDIGAIQQALETYRNDKGYYPDSSDDLVSDNYIKVLPKDPKNSALDYSYVAAPAGCTNAGTKCRTYTLSTNQLEAPTGSYSVTNP